VTNKPAAGGCSPCGPCSCCLVCPAHLKQCLAHTLALMTLMHIEIQHTQRLNLNNGPVGLQDKHSSSLA